MVKEIIKNRKIIYGMAISDFRKRFVGSAFGIIWMFIQPLATVLVYTLIFQVGFRATPPIPNVPYVVWLIAGIVPWFYFQDAILQNTNCMIEYNFLVKKVVFDVRLLPIVKLISTFFAHLFFLLIMFILLIIFGVNVKFSWLLVFYYTFMLSILILGISYITSSINVFFRDMGQLIGILLQFGIWMCPIMYDEKLFAGKTHIIIKILRLNPMYYIVKGYRNALIGEEITINWTIETFYYIVFSVIILFLGYKLFEKLKDEFADVI